jgi:aryl-alcohol dehydrogenase-like predicted oxidoreductase
MPVETAVAPTTTSKRMDVGPANSLDTYRLLGRSGLRVSPLALGTMTFGSDWGWGAGRDEAKAMFDKYVEYGGNFIDSANGYTNGTAEQLVGEFAKGRRDQLVIATKYTMGMRPGDPNAGGNHRKSMVRSFEASLARLQTDYADLLYLHMWDGTTPIEEILRAMDDLVSAGKVLYVGISDTPAWEVARMQAVADLRGWSPLIALQIEYSLVERTVERELIPMVSKMGLGVIPWSLLGRGILTGKYNRADLSATNASEPDGTRRHQLAERGAINERDLGAAQPGSDRTHHRSPHPPPARGQPRRAQHRDRRRAARPPRRHQCHRGWLPLQLASKHAAVGGRARIGTTNPLRTCCQAGKPTCVKAVAPQRRLDG